MRPDIEEYLRAGEESDADFYRLLNQRRNLCNYALELENRLAYLYDSIGHPDATRKEDALEKARPFINAFLHARGLNDIACSDWAGQSQPDETVGDLEWFRLFSAWPGWPEAWTFEHFQEQAALHGIPFRQAVLIATAPSVDPPPGVHTHMASGVDERAMAELKNAKGKLVIKL